MFSCLCRRKKKCQFGVKPGDEQSTRPQKSVNVEVDQKQETVAPDTPPLATSATTVSAPAEAPKKKTRKVSWWRKLLRSKNKIEPQPVKEDVVEDTNLPSSTTENRVDTITPPEGGEAGVQEASPTPDTPFSAATLPQPEKDDVSTNVDTVSKSDGGEDGVQEASPTPDTPFSAATLPQPEKDDVSTNVDTVSESDGGEDGVQEASPTPDTPFSAATLPQPEKDDVSTNVDTVSESDGGEDGVQEASPTPDTPFSAATLPQPEKDDVSTNVDTVSEFDGGEDGVQEASPTPDTPFSAATLPQSEKDDVSFSFDTINESEDDGTSVWEMSLTPDTPFSAATLPQPEKDDVSFSFDTVSESDGGEDGVQEASPTPDTPFSAATLPQSEKDDVSTNVDTVSKSDGGEDGVQEASPTPDTPFSAATLPQSEKDDVSTSTATINESEDEGTSVWETSLEELRSLSPVETDDGVETNYSSETQTPRRLTSDLAGSRQSTPLGHGGSLQVEPDNISLLASGDQLLSASASTETLSREELVCLGLPNLAQTCYMNSILQGLLTLTPFIQEIYNQQSVWSSHPSSQFLREFMDIAVCRFSNNKAEKKSALAAFKKTIAEFNSEFDDDSQKDAHEFLSCVLDILSSLYIDLYTAAVEMDLSYTCPVHAHITFQMLSTRTCKGCGVQSIRQEDNMNLFLNLVPGGSVSKSLQDYLKESSLVYRCQCGAKESSHQHSFLTLPNVLILQLQRFRFTSSFSLKKVNRPIVLSRELVMNPERSTTEQTRYSLVSIISHLGPTSHSGHYVCDGSYRQQKPGDMTDRWLTYNDNDIREATGESVCQHRQRTAYLLFYEKQ